MRYPTMFKPSQRCRAPHMNVDVLRNEMHEVLLLHHAQVLGCMHVLRNEMHELLLFHHACMS